MVVVPVVIPMTRAVAPPHEAVEAMAMRASRRLTADLLGWSSKGRLTDKPGVRQPARWKIAS